MKKLVLLLVLVCSLNLMKAATARWGDDSSDSDEADTQEVGVRALIQCYTPNIICDDVSVKEYEGIVFCWKPKRRPPKNCSWVVAKETQGIKLYKLICD